MPVRISTSFSQKISIFVYIYLLKPVQTRFQSLSTIANIPESFDFKLSSLTLIRVPVWQSGEAQGNQHLTGDNGRSHEMWSVLWLQSQSCSSSSYIWKTHKNKLVAALPFWDSVWTNSGRSSSMWYWYCDIGDNYFHLGWGEMGSWEQRLLNGSVAFLYPQDEVIFTV